MNDSGKPRYTFGEFSLDVSERMLLRKGQVVPLPPKVFDTLVLLVENAGHLVEKEAFLQRLWPGVFVGEDALTRNICLLRKALGGTNDSQAVIVTVPTRGYRFEANVRETKPDADAAAAMPSRDRAKSVAAAFVILLTLGAATWFVRHRFSSATAQPATGYRQLTFNSFENRVKSGAISPDEKYLAYSDMNGMYLKLLATGETRTIPQPEGFSTKNVEWEIARGPWFPDSASFLANAHPVVRSSSLRDSPDANIWIISVAGGPPRKLRDDAVAYSVSPDGAWVFFGTGQGNAGEREIWVMNSSGEQARKVDDTVEGSSIFGLSWTADAKRVIYGRVDESGVAVLSRDLQGEPPVTLLPESATKGMENLASLPDGRLLYSVREDTDLPDTCNAWTMRLNPRDGRVVEKPRQLTNFSGSCVGRASVTADGKKFAFLRWAGHITSYVADLTPEGSIAQPRHFPLSESSDGICDWTVDGRNVILVSNRAGDFGIYKQPLNGDALEPVVTKGYGRDPRVTPDGKWILYLGMGRREQLAETRPQPVMRVPVGGGASQFLFTAKPWSLIACSRPPSKLCAIGEWTDDHKQLTVTTLDQLTGRGPELARFALDPNEKDWYLDLSPDGTRVAVTRSPAGPIHVLSLRGQATQEIHTKNWNDLRAFSWAADGKGLFVVTGIRGGRVILYVDLKGTERVLWEQTGGSAETIAVPSPDGRHLAMQGWTTTANVWMTENL